MAGWYDTMRRRWGYNNIPANDETKPDEGTQPAVETKPEETVQPNSANQTETTQPVTESQWFENFYKQNMLTPITPEEEQRRVRGAQAAQAIGHLGNVLSSFSNLVFTDKGAPSQTLPNVPDLNIRTFEDRIAEKRRQYIAGQMSARNNDRKALIDRINLELKQKDDERKDDLNKAKIEGIAFDNYLTKLKAKYQEGLNKGLPEKQAAELALKNAQVEAQKAAAARSRAQAEAAQNQSNKVVDSAIGSDGKIYTRNTKLSENEAMQIVQSTGLNGEDIAPFMIEEKDYLGNVTKRKIDWIAAAAYALQNGMVNAEELKSRGFKLGGERTKTYTVNDL